MVSLYPRPDDYKEQFPDAMWERDEAKCETLAPSQDAVEQTASGGGTDVVARMIADDAKLAR